MRMMKNRYSTRKIKDFVQLMKVMKQVTDSVKSISESFSSALLKDLFTVCSPEMSDALDLAFPDMTEVLDFFDHSFDHDRAIEQGIIMPQPGIDSELDQISSDLQETQDDLDQYLEDIRSRFHCP